MSEAPGPVAAPYARYCRTFFVHAAITLARRHRAILAGAMALLPVVIPVAIAFLSDAQFAANGNRVFANMAEYAYLRALVPLLALFFACMLIGEDVESQTMVYVLSRPVPRSAVVVGKFAAFVVVSGTILVPSLCLTYFACTLLGSFEVSWTGLKLLLHYSGVVLAGLAGYGALAMLLGALTKRPIIYGIMFVFGWQRLAMYIPGLVDFFTIEKYLKAMLPPLPTQRDVPAVRAALLEFQKKEFLVGAVEAAITLAVITLLLIWLTQWVLRRREYTTARSVGN